MSAETASRVRDSGAQIILATMVDNAGVTRLKVLPVDRLESVARSGLGWSRAMSVICSDDGLAETPTVGGPVGDMRYIPDVDALQLLDADRGIAWVPLDQFDQDLTTSNLCQRSQVVRQQDIAARLGFRYLVAFEIEFNLFAQDGGPANSGPAYGLVSVLGIEEFALDLLAALKTAGVQVETFHAESGPGQLELSVAPLAPVAAADCCVLTRLVVTRTAVKHGFRASFGPITVENAIGNGCHMHFSALEGGANVFAGGPRESDVETPATGRQMIAGLVQYLPEALGVLTPSIVSYERLVPGAWAGAYACWGVENREAAVRLIPGTISTRTQSANVEVKSVDHTSNAYLAVAAIMGMSLAGVAEGIVCPAPVNKDPGLLTSSERDRARMRRFPESLDSAIDLLDGSAKLRQILGDEVVDCLVAIRRREFELYGDRPVKERLDVTSRAY